ncbi:MAG TPA: allantoinase AllB [Candidatus Didemnitutus sp.]|nr:allantoinase AllB [Candidatus Didemnitutus sp.]
MSSDFDLVVRGGTVVTPTATAVADVGIAEGRIVAVARALRGSARTEVDARGHHVFPGILDAHVHFNEPGRTDWEGLATGSAALAAGGGAWFADMPLNSLPPVLDAASFAEKKALAEKKSVTDFSLWGGLVPGNLDRLGELRDAGAIALKAFMCGSGVDEFPGVTDAATLRAGMKRAAALGMMVAVHAEDEALAARLTAEEKARGATDVRSWLSTRPVEVELKAIRLATELAGETGCRLHVVHVSSPEGIDVITKARARGVDVTAETCPHYLLLNEDDVIRLGASAKCCPLLRPEALRQELWRKMDAGKIDTIGSDHSPAPPAMKTSADFFAIWGGISGCQHGFPLLIGEAWRLGEPSLAALAALLAANVARRFRLPHKGAVAVGNDADLTILALGGTETLRNEDLLYRHRQGPYAGRTTQARVVDTFVRGRSVTRKPGIAPGAPTGQFVAPNPS